MGGGKFHTQIHSSPVMLDVFEWQEKSGVERAAEQNVL